MDTYTTISEIIEPSIFNAYLQEVTAEKSYFLNSGIAIAMPQLTAEMEAKGKAGGVINVPYWGDLSGDDEVVNDDTTLTVNAIDTFQDKAIMCLRGKAWGNNDLAGMFAGSDPAAAIASRLVAFWDRKYQTTLSNLLVGTLGAATMTGNVYDISEEATLNYFTGEALIDAQGILGDAQDSLGSIAMHGKVYTAIKKLNLIDFIPDAEGKSTIPTYMGKPVTVDDNLTTSGEGAATVYSTFLFGSAPVVFNEIQVPKWSLDTDRDILAANEVMVTRKAFVMHMQGVKWLGGSLAGDSPTNAELATTTNWQRVYENKNIKVVEFKHKLAA
ncbi:MAG: major capsid protein [Phycisphaerae bacterium]|jgi:hypothetical protein